MPSRREKTAFHEAGHTVAAYHAGVKIHWVTIVPGHGYAGTLDYGDVFCGKGLDSDRVALCRAIQICLAGPLAQQRFHRKSYRRWQSRGDYDSASGLARYLAGSAGERDFLRYQERLTRKLIERYWTDIAQVARALVERDLLIGAEVSEIIAPTGRLLASEHHAERARWEEAMQDEEDQSDRDQCPPTESITGHEAG